MARLSAERREANVKRAEKMSAFQPRRRREATELSRLPRGASLLACLPADGHSKTKFLVILWRNAARWAAHLPACLPTCLPTRLHLARVLDRQRGRDAGRRNTSFDTRSSSPFLTRKDIVQQRMQAITHFILLLRNDSFL